MNRHGGGEEEASVVPADRTGNEKQSEAACFILGGPFEQRDLWRVPGQSFRDPPPPPDVVDTVLLSAGPVPEAQLSAER